jgi:hypothetical protein
MMRILIIFLIVTIILGACGTGNIPENPVLPEAPVINDPIVITETNTPPVINNERELSPHNIKALSLIGYYEDENGNIYTVSDNWELCEPDVFRQYMFGTWEGSSFLNWGEPYFVFDDSEASEPANLKNAVEFYRNGSTIIFWASDRQTGGAIYWLDINEPDILYSEGVFGGWNEGHTFFNLSMARSGDENFNLNHQINFLTRTDTPINQPQNGFMSRLRLHEIMRDYNINFDMLFDIRHIETVGGQFLHFVMDGYYNTFPIYLISEEADRLVFKSELWQFRYSFVDVTYTLEKADGEWIRTININEEQLAGAVAKAVEEISSHNPDFFQFDDEPVQ